jgi:putative methionine-R-sulfoxide reductase with GAF domain
MIAPEDKPAGRKNLLQQIGFLCDRLPYLLWVGLRLCESPILIQGFFLDNTN